MQISLDSQDTITMLQRVAYIVEYREGDKRSHIERVKGYTYILSRGLGLGMEAAKNISLASQLHDIGKFIIPDEISQKSDDLSPGEWVIIEKHTTSGAALLQGFSSELIQTASQIALTHHERWNGSGYPNKLAGDNIPINGRICAIADVFDALTTQRPYKKEINVIDARNLIIGASGVLFDPELVDIFNASFEDILDIRNNNII